MGIGIVLLTLLEDIFIVLTGALDCEKQQEGQL